jgi:hypothetical protein
MRRSIERRLEILETTSSHAEPLGSYIALDEAGNLVFPRGPVPSMYLEELTRIVGSTFTAG